MTQRNAAKYSIEVSAVGSQPEQIYFGKVMQGDVTGTAAQDDVVSHESKGGVHRSLAC